MGWLGRAPSCGASSDDGSWCVHRARLLSSLSLLACTLVGCSVSLDANRTQCSSDADCTARGAAFAGSHCLASVCQADPKWACVAGSSSPPVTTGGPFRVTMHFTDLVKRTPLVGVHAELCRKVDVSCAEPAASVVSDTSGSILLQIEAAFSGYLSIHDDAIVPTLYFFNPTIDRDLDIPALSLSNGSARGALLGQLQADTTRADVLLHAFDCQGNGASEVSFSITPNDGQVIPYYLSSGLPTRSSTETDSTGYGGFVNLASGTVTVTATNGRTKTVLDSLTLVVRAGSATWSSLVPQ